MEEVKEVRLAVVGRRTFNNYYVLEDVLNRIRDAEIYKYVLMVSGGARGADSFGEIYADKFYIKKLIVYKLIKDI